MKKGIINTLILIFLEILLTQCVLSTPLKKDAFSVLLKSQSDRNLQQSKQFIGSSVIGGLMWPVLLTLTVTAIMARVPDALQRLLTGTGSRHSNYREKRSNEKDQYLDRIMEALLISFDVVENSNLQAKFQKQNNVEKFSTKFLVTS